MQFNGQTDSDDFLQKIVINTENGRLNWVPEIKLVEQGKKRQAKFSAPLPIKEDGVIAGLEVVAEFTVTDVYGTADVVPSEDSNDLRYELSLVWDKGESSKDAKDKSRKARYVVASGTDSLKNKPTNELLTLRELYREVAEPEVLAKMTAAKDDPKCKSDTAKAIFAGVDF